MGPSSRYVGKHDSTEELVWQDPVPAVMAPSEKELTVGRERFAASGFTWKRWS